MSGEGLTDGFREHAVEHTTDHAAATPQRSTGDDELLFVRASEPTDGESDTSDTDAPADRPADRIPAQWNPRPSAQPVNPWDAAPLTHIPNVPEAPERPALRTTAPGTMAVKASVELGAETPATKVAEAAPPAKVEGRATVATPQPVKEPTTTPPENQQIAKAEDLAPTVREQTNGPARQELRYEPDRLRETGRVREQYREAEPNPTRPYSQTLSESQRVALIGKQAAVDQALNKIMDRHFDRLGPHNKTEDSPHHSVVVSVSLGKEVPAFVQMPHLEHDPIVFKSSLTREGGMLSQLEPRDASGVLASGAAEGNSTPGIRAAYQSIMNSAIMALEQPYIDPESGFEEPAKPVTPEKIRDAVNVLDGGRTASAFGNTEVTALDPFEIEKVLGSINDTRLEYIKGHLPPLSDFLNFAIPREGGRVEPAPQREYRHFVHDIDPDDERTRVAHIGIEGRDEAAQAQTTLLPYILARYVEAGSPDGRPEAIVVSDAHKATPETLRTLVDTCAEQEIPIILLYTKVPEGHEGLLADLDIDKGIAVHDALTASRLSPLFGTMDIVKVTSETHGGGVALSRDKHTGLVKNYENSFGNQKGGSGSSTTGGSLSTNLTIAQTVSYSEGQTIPATAFNKLSNYDFAVILGKQSMGIYDLLSGQRTSDFPDTSHEPKVIDVKQEIRAGQEALGLETDWIEGEVVEVDHSLPGRDGNPALPGRDDRPQLSGGSRSVERAPDRRPSGWAQPQIVDAHFITPTSAEIVGSRAPLPAHSQANNLRDKYNRATARSSYGLAAKLSKGFDAFIVDEYWAEREAAVNRYAKLYRSGQTQQTWYEWSGGQYAPAAWYVAHGVEKYYSYFIKGRGSADRLAYFERSKNLTSRETLDMAAYLAVYNSTRRVRRL